MGKRTPTDPLGRLLARIEIDPDTECWIWQGTKSKPGYGYINAGNRVTASTHRLAYLRLVGPIPDGLELDHLCRNPPCCNPDHLEPVTRLENIQRSPSGEFTRNQAAMRALADRYEAGESADALAAEFGTNPATILQRIKKVGARPRRSGARRVELPGLVEEYLAGEVPYVLSKRYGVSEETVLRRVKDAGGTVRPRGGQTGRPGKRVTNATN